MVNPDYAGRVYPPMPVIEISREKIIEFALATGGHPFSVDPEAARQAGYPDVVAPPTFAVSIAQRCDAQLMTDPAAQVDFSRVVHGEQGFVHHRPIVAGDQLTAVLHVDRVRAVGGHTMLTTRSELTDSVGAQVCTATSTMIIRGES